MLHQMLLLGGWDEGLCIGWSLTRSVRRSFVHSLALIHPIQREQQYNWEG